MGNTKTDDSGIITTEFYTGRCPVRCEMCFVNFGEGGSSVPFTIYSKPSKSVYAYANCTGTDEKLAKLPKNPPMGWVKDVLCKGGGPKGRNNQARRWKPVRGFDLKTDREVDFWPGMTKDDFLSVLKPLGDDPGLYNIPKVPEEPWRRKIEATRAYNGQWLPSVLRVNSMSDSSVAPTKWIEEIRQHWGEDCFFNTNVHALIGYPANMRSGLFHKVVVTANPGLQKLYAGVERYKLHFPTKQDVAADPEIVALARALYPDLGPKASKNKVAQFLTKLTWEELYGLVTLRLGAGTMKGSAERPWHFFKPARISDIRKEFAPYEQNIKFYRVRALPTIQPDVSKFDGQPVVYTVLRFKTVAQTLEWAAKYGIEARCVVKNRKDEVVCDYYGVDYRLAKEKEPSLIQLRSNHKLNASPRKGEWTNLFFQGNFFRAGKKQMTDMQFVCDRASQSCKACGLCATLDGTEPDWTNPRLGQIGLKPKEYSKQTSYVSNANGEPIATKGVRGRVTPQKIDMSHVSKKINRTKEELDFFYGPGEMKFWNQAELDRAAKEKARQQKREQNPAADVAEPALGQLAVLESFARGPRRNPFDKDLIPAMQKSLRLVIDYGTQGTKGVDDFWVQGWNTHEDVSTMIAYVYWWLMVLSKEDGLDYEDAIAAARGFSYDAVGMDLFEDDEIELSMMYYNRSLWNDQFGPT